MPARSSLTRTRPAVRRAWHPRLEILEDRTLLATGVQLQSAFLCDVNGHQLSRTLDIGEEVAVEANWTTQGLPANAQYRVQYTVDGITLYSPELTLGAGGSGTGNWFWFREGWFAAPGGHNVQVTLDPDHSVTDIGNTTSTFNFTPQSATDLPQKFVIPIGGTPFKNWVIVNYVDVDPRTTTYADYKGGNYTYDGHAGMDITLPNFSAMDAGVPVYAAAAGTVIAVQDGNYDRNTAFSNAPANYVEIDNGSGWETIYYHFRRNTISVKVGDAVTQGEQVGLVGSSGDSTAAHLHFEVHHDGAVVETNEDSSTFWINPLPYQGNVDGVTDMGVAIYNPVADLNAEERPVEATNFLQAPNQTPYAWFVGNTLNNDKLDFIWYEPNGTVFTDQTFTSSENRNGYYYAFVTLPNSPPLGTWHVAIDINGTEFARQSFTVSTMGAPELRLLDGNTYVVNGRTTPLDFGAMAQGGPGPQLTFTLQNVGNAALTFGNLSLPSGFKLIGNLPASVAAGSTATFTLALDTSAHGSKSGQVSLSTNASGQSTYTFNVSGLVSWWQGADVAVGSDNKTRLLWSTPDGQTSEWSVANANLAATAGQAYGPFNGWTGKATAAGGDGITRVLWTNTNGTAALWLEDAAGTFQNAAYFGPFAGWAAQDVAVGSDNLTRILWTNTNGQVVIWSVNNSFNVTSSPVYGPISGWSVRNLAAGSDGMLRLLWTSTDGATAIWLLNAAGNYQNSAVFGALSGWTATDVTVGSDNNTRILWANTNGAAAIWSLNASLVLTTSTVYGPFAGWAAARLTAGSDGTLRLLWDNVDGAVALWVLNSNGTFVGSGVFGPF